jgi:hypothetical protein
MEIPARQKIANTFRTAKEETQCKHGTVNKQLMLRNQKMNSLRICNAP